MSENATSPDALAVLLYFHGGGFTIGSGYGKNKDTTVRVGHMGDHTLAGLERCLQACDAAFAEVVVPIDP